jgi:putative FmdB family regulatory protein
MPIYEYNCTKCRKHFELMQKMSDAGEAKCPDCGHSSKRVISRTSFSLKGGGWYKDGYSSGGGGGGKAGAKTEGKKK